MVPLKTHVKYNVFVMTNLKTHAPVHKKEAKKHEKHKKVLKPMRLCTKLSERAPAHAPQHPDTRTREAQR